MKNDSIIQKTSMILVGIECRTSNAPGAASNDIPKLWEQFSKENIRDKIPNKSSNDVIALYCDYEGDHTKPYTVVIGCAVSSLHGVPANLTIKAIPAAAYTIFRAVGEHPKSLMETWGKIWQTDLKRTYTGDFEVYGSKFTSGSPQEVDVYISIKDPNP